MVRTAAPLLLCLVCWTAAALAEIPQVGHLAARGEIAVKLTCDKPTYRVGELARVSLKSQSTGYFLLYYLDGQGQATLVVPSSFSSFDRVYAGQTLQIRDNRGRLLVQQGPPGEETLVALVTRERLGLSALQAYLSTPEPAPRIADLPGFVQALQGLLQTRIEAARRAGGAADSACGVYGEAVVRYTVVEGGTG